MAAIPRSGAVSTTVTVTGNWSGPVGLELNPSTFPIENVNLKLRRTVASGCLFSSESESDWSSSFRSEEQSVGCFKLPSALRLVELRRDLKKHTAWSDDDPPTSKRSESASSSSTITGSWPKPEHWQFQARQLSNMRAIGTFKTGKKKIRQTRFQ